MDRLTEFLKAQGGQGDQLDTWEVLFALMLSLACLMVISLVYRFTHRTSSYSQSFVHTLVLTGMVTSLIMIVIGSNIARAFSLVGALSIIRFRNAVKETRDIGFIFFAMAIAMACGTRFYLPGILATGLINSVITVLYLTDFGIRRSAPERLLAVQMPAGVDVEKLLEPTLDRLFQSHSVVSIESVKKGMFSEVTLSVRPKQDISGSDVVNELSAVNQNLKVRYNYASHSDNL